jgi:hypothetical protein
MRGKNRAVLTFIPLIANALSIYTLPIKVATDALTGIDRNLTIVPSKTHWAVTISCIANTTVQAIHIIAFIHVAGNSEQAD